MWWKYWKFYLVLNHWIFLFLNFVFRHSEYVAELFFLQNNGNMMEYPTWRKKSNTQQFINFMKSHRLEPPPLEEPEQSSRQVCNFSLSLNHFQLIRGGCRESLRSHSFNCPDCKIIQFFSRNKLKTAGGTLSKIDTLSTTKKLDFHF